jgi:hypothetical protein
LALTYQERVEWDHINQCNSVETLVCIGIYRGLFEVICSCFFMRINAEYLCHIERNFGLNNILVQINDEDLKYLSNVVGYPGAR